MLSGFELEGALRDFFELGRLDRRSGAEFEDGPGGVEGLARLPSGSGQGGGVVP